MEVDLHYITLNLYNSVVDTGSAVLGYHNYYSRFMLEVDYTTTITTIIGEGFVWEDQVDYTLEVTIVTPTEWTAVPSKCFVTGGFLNTKGGMVTCRMISYNVILVENFQKMVNSLFGYRVKMELNVARLVNPAAVSVSVNSRMFANSAFYPSLDWIFSSTSNNTYTRAVPYYPSTAASGSIVTGCGGYPMYAWPTFATSFSTWEAANNINTVISDFGFAGGSNANVNAPGVLNLKFRLYSTTTRNLRTLTTIYPFFHFYIDGLKSNITGTNFLTITYVDPGAGYSYGYTPSSWGLGYAAGGNTFSFNF